LYRWYRIGCTILAYSNIQRVATTATQHRNDIDNTITSNKNNSIIPNDTTEPNTTILNNKNTDTKTSQDEVVNDAANTDNVNNTINSAANMKLPLLTLNNCQIRTEYYWWGSGTIQIPGNDTNNTDTESDIIVIVSDCVLPKLYPIMPLVEAIDELLITPTSIAILSYEYRYYKESYDPKTQFTQYCLSKNLIVQTIPISQHHPLYRTNDIEIWHVHRGSM
jgi:hypothetical protein